MIELFLKTCHFFGYRDSSEKIYLSLYFKIKKHILQYNVIDFLSGGYGNFDQMNSGILHELKRKN